MPFAKTTRFDLRRVAIIYCIWKIVVLLIGYFAVYKFGVGISEAWEKVGVFSVFQYTAHFDAGWYYSIAAHGYKASAGAPAFYPLFPFLVRLLGLVGISEVTAGYFINFIAGFFAFYYLYKLALDFFTQDRGKAMMVLLAFAFFPMSFFLDVGYSEALFCALSFGALYYARQHRWLIANVFVLFATATRLPGLIVALAVLVEYGSTIKWRVRTIGREALSFLLAPLGFLLYMLYAAIRLSDGLAMFHAYQIADWSYQRFNLNIPWNITSHIGNVVWQLRARPRGWQASVFDASGLFAWLAGVWFVVLAIRKRYPASFLVLMGVSLVLFAINSNFVSTFRYLLPLFPIYFITTEFFFKRRDYFGLYIGLSAMLMSMCLALFASGIWVA